MKRFAALLVASLSVCVLTSILMAQDTGKPKVDGDKPKVEGKKDGVKEGGPGKMPDIAARIDKMVGGLTDDQKAKVAELNKAREQAIKEIQNKFEADVKALLTPEQQAKMDAAREANKGDKPRGDKPAGDKPAGDKPVGDKP